MSLSSRSRVPPVPLVGVSKGRIQRTDEVPKGLAAEALRRSFTGTGEDPGVLRSIPEQ